MQNTYVIETQPKAIVCLICDMKSYNPYDVANKYCNKCKIFHEDEMRRRQLSNVNAR